eukprot:51872-Amphidinium_carterae.1
MMIHVCTWTCVLTILSGATQDNKNTLPNWLLKIEEHHLEKASHSTSTLQLLVVFPSLLYSYKKHNQVMQFLVFCCSVSNRVSVDGPLVDTWTVMLPHKTCNSVLVLLVVCIDLSNAIAVASESLRHSALNHAASNMMLHQPCQYNRDRIHYITIQKQR